MRDLGLASNHSRGPPAPLAGLSAPKATAAPWAHPASNPQPYPGCPRPSPGPGRAGAGTELTDPSRGLTSLSAAPLSPRLYMAYPPPAHPEKLLESWKSFRRAQRLNQKKPKTSPKSPRSRPLPLRELSRPLGPIAPLRRMRREDPPPWGGRRDPHDLQRAGVLRLSGNSGLLLP